MEGETRLPLLVDDDFRISWLEQPHDEILVGDTITSVNNVAVRHSMKIEQLLSLDVTTYELGLTRLAGNRLLVDASLCSPSTSPVSYPITHPPSTLTSLSERCATAECDEKLSQAAPPIAAPPTAAALAAALTFLSSPSPSPASSPSAHPAASPACETPFPPASCPASACEDAPPLATAAAGRSLTSLASPTPLASSSSSPSNTTEAKDPPDPEQQSPTSQREGFFSSRRASSESFYVLLPPPTQPEPAFVSMLETRPWGTLGAILAPVLESDDELASNFSSRQ
ncbi:MAG: hypothetical protein SGPRY_011090, partial [Prymnesium sp.]